MGYAAFLNLPAFGHINVTLAYVSELVARGERVVYYSTPAFRDVIEAAGAEFRPYPPAMRNDMHGSPVDAFRISEWIIHDTAIILPALLDEFHADPPKYIIHDVTCLWARLAAKLIQVPTIVTFPVFVMGPATLRSSVHLVWNLLTTLPRGMTALLRSFRVMRRLRRAHGVSFPPGPRALVNKGDLNIVFLNQRFQPSGWGTDHDRFVFVGPSVGGARREIPFPMEKLTGKPLVLVSLGTLFNEHPEFYKHAAEALGALDVQVIMATGTHTDPASLGPLPDNVLAFRSVPQVDLLARASLFITHGGMNSVSESLWHGVPLITVPQIIEQRLNGARAAALGAGELIEPGRVTVDRLRRLASMVLDTPSYRENAQSLSRACRRDGGAVMAAEETLRFLAGRPPVAPRPLPPLLPRGVNV